MLESYELKFEMWMKVILCEIFWYKKKKDLFCFRIEEFIVRYEILLRLYNKDIIY